MKIDTHCHTREGSLDCKVSIDRYITLLKAKGFDGMLVTDHNSYNGYRAWVKEIKGKKHKDFKVFKGIEYDTIDAGHIIVIMPEGINLRILELRGLPVYFLIDIVHKNGGILGPAHPCGEKYQSITNTRKHRNQLAVMDKFDFVEGFNSCENSQSNHAATALAQQFEKPRFGGSDAHKEDCVGLAYTEFPEQLERETDLINSVKEKKVIQCGGQYYSGTTKEKIGFVKHILVQSFWVYNRFGSLYRHSEREAELQKQMY